MQLNQEGYYELVRQHLSLNDTTTALNELRTSFKEDMENQVMNIQISNFLIYLKKQKFSPEFKKIILKGQDFNKGDLESLQNKVMAYVIFRISYYAKKNENQKESISSEFLKRSAIFLFNEKNRDDPKYFLTLLSFVLNFSRGLIDDDAEFMDQFSANWLKLKKILDEGPNKIMKIDSFDDVGEIPDLFRDGIKAFHESLTSLWARMGLKSYLASVGLQNTIEEVITALDKMPIYIIKEEFGIYGMICFGYVIFSLSKLTQGLTGSAIIARVFVCLWHEASHYLLRTLSKDFLANTARGNGDGDSKYSDLEGGYRLERFLFGTYQYRIWKDSYFSNLILKRQWYKISTYKNTDFKGKPGLEIRESHFNSSGMEMSIITSCIE